MITLIGHGYIGTEIESKMCIDSRFQYHWIHHNESIPKNTSVIINAAGYTGSPNVDACEIYRDETINGNVLWPLYLEKTNLNIPIIHISSGCVYTGYDKEYTELDPPNFTFSNGSFYSGSKALAQSLLEPYMHKSYLLRIRMPFGSTQHQKNFLTKLHKYNKLIDFRNSLSCVDDVADVVICMAINELYKTDKRAPGIYNVVNPGSKTTKEIANMMGITKDWFTYEEFSEAVTAPRSNCVLSSNKLDSIFKIPSIDVALKKAIENYTL